MLQSSLRRASHSPHPWPSGKLCQPAPYRMDLCFKPVEKLVRFQPLTSLSMLVILLPGVR